MWRADSHVWPSVARMVATCSHPRLCQPCALMLADRVLARGVWLFTLAQSCRHETMPWTHGVCGIVRGSKLGVRTTHRQMPSCRWPYALWMGHVSCPPAAFLAPRAARPPHSHTTMYFGWCVERQLTRRVFIARRIIDRVRRGRAAGRAPRACVSTGGRAEDRATDA